MIRFHRVNKGYATGFQALSNVSFELLAGDMAFLTGHSGAGKSTLLKLLCMMERPSSGQVFFCGQDLSRLRPSQIPWVRRRIGVIFQHHRLLKDRSVFDNVALPLQLEAYPKAEIVRRVGQALERVGLTGKEKLLPDALSGGEQQRVGVARATVAKPMLLLADEPTGNLDPELAQDLFELFADFNRAGATVLIASHDLGMISKMAYPVLHLKQGSLVFNGLEQEG